MLRKCFGCIQRIGWRFFGENMPRWQQHINNYCFSNSQRYVWCQMILDNFDLIRTYEGLSKELEHEIRNTNIASEVIKLITNYYEKDENPFRFCIQLFGSYLKLKYSQVINASKTTFNKLLKDYQEFMTLLIDLIVIYFGLQDREILGQDLFYNYTLPCLIIGFFFENEDISGTVHYIIKQVYRQSIEKIQFNQQKYSSTMKLSDFQISQQLQLNQKTLKKFNVKGQIDNNQKPYSGTVQIIKQVIRVNNPVQKLHLIQGLHKQMQSTIHAFYKKYGIKVQRIEIDYQNSISILLYILIQANQPSLYSNLQLIINFGPNKKKTKNNDYSLDTLTVLQLIEKGSVLRQSREEIDLSIQRNIQQVSSYFDEVSTFEL